MSDFVLYLRVISALGAVLALVVLISYFLRRYGGDRFKAARGKRRLAVIEVAGIDQRRRLVLVRRDEVEHLLMIGGANDVLIESRIAAAESNETPATAVAPRNDLVPAPSGRRDPLFKEIP